MDFYFPLIAGGSDYTSSADGATYGQSWGLSGSGQPDYKARAAITNSAQGVRAINDIFQNGLQRAPRPDELFNAQTLIVNGGSFQDFVYEQAHSLEAAGLIRNEFSQLFDTAAPQAAVNERVAYLQGHGSQASIRWDDAHQPGEMTLVSSFVQAVQGRLAGSSDMAFIYAQENAIGNGEAADQVRYNLAHSPSETGVIGTVIQSVQGRPLASSDTSFVQAQENLLGSGSETLAQIRSKLAHASGEAGVIGSVIESVQGRAIAASDTSFTQNEENVIGNAGESLAQFRYNLSHASSENAIVSTLYQHELGRTGSGSEIRSWEDAIGNGLSLYQTDAAFANSTEAVSKETSDLKNLLIIREGNNPKVYIDSRNVLTVGIGHVVQPSDNLRLGDTILTNRVDTFFASDTAAALASAQQQAGVAGILDVPFVAYLASVNFQLGKNWILNNPNTWGMFSSGNYAAAAKSLYIGPWYQQTPTRVADFQQALLRLPSKPVQY